MSQVRTSHAQWHALLAQHFRDAEQALAASHSKALEALSRGQPSLLDVDPVVQSIGAESVRISTDGMTGSTTQTQLQNYDNFRKSDATRRSTARMAWTADLKTSNTHAPLGSGHEAAMAQHDRRTHISDSSRSVAKVQHVPDKAPRRGSIKDIWSRSKTLFREDTSDPSAREELSPTLFADAEAMKERVRYAMCRKEYKVSDFYHNGWSAYVADNSYFEQAVLAVICFNAVWLAVDTDYNESVTLNDATPLFQAVEIAFFIFFSVEICIRFLAFERKVDAARNLAFCFDSMLMALMLLETVIVPIMIAVGGGGGFNKTGTASLFKLFRLLRATRLARIARILRAIPELMILLKGITVASRTVFFTLCLLVIVIYVFAVTFVQIMAGSDDAGAAYFATVPDAMGSLLLHGVFLENIPELMKRVGRESFFYGAILLLFILIATLTILNMLVGVLVEVVGVVASVEKEKMLITFVKGKLVKIMEKVVGVVQEGDDDLRISQEQFMLLLQSPEGARCLHDVGVDPVGLVDFIGFLFQETDQFSFQELINLVLSLRGSNTATVKDIVDLRKCIMKELKDGSKGSSHEEQSGASQAMLLCKIDSRDEPSLREAALIEAAAIEAFDC